MACNRREHGQRGWIAASGDAERYARQAPKRFRLVITGVGGQGVLTVAIMVGDAALRQGENMVVGQLHGMSQRGGSVETTVLIGPGESSFVDAGGAHVVLAFEPLEALRALPFMSGDTRVLVNEGRVVPFPLSMRGLPYPDLDGIFDRIRQVTPHVVTLPGTRLVAEEVGELRCLNMLMLGALAGLEMVPISSDTLRAATEHKSKPAHQEVNLLAFDLGFASVKDRAGP